MLEPISPNDWDRAKAGHLLNRAGFGGPPEQIDALAQAGMTAALRQLFRPRLRLGRSRVTWPPSARRSLTL